MSDKDMDFKDDESFVVFKFLGQHSAAFQPVFNMVSPMQLLVLSKYLEWLAYKQMDEEHDKRTTQRPENKIAVASSLPPNMTYGK